MLVTSSSGVLMQGRFLGFVGVVMLLVYGEWDVLSGLLVMGYGISLSY
jgi:hypothetical protein